MIRVYGNIYLVLFSRDFCLIKLKYHNGRFQPVKLQKARVSCGEKKKANDNMYAHGYTHTIVVSVSQPDLAFLCMCHPMPAVAAAWAPDPLTNPDCLLIPITLSSSCHWLHYSSAVFKQSASCNAPYLSFFNCHCPVLCWVGAEWETSNVNSHCKRPYKPMIHPHRRYDDTK